MDFEKYDYDASSPMVSAVSENERGAFLTRVYLNLTGAVLALAAIETLLFAFVGCENIVRAISANSIVAMIGVLALCLVGPFVADMILNSARSRAGQYAALGFHVLLEAAIITPLLAFAAAFLGYEVIWSAVGLTAAVFVTLSAMTLMLRANFSFLLPILSVGAIASVGAVVFSLIFGFSLGIWFSVAMIVLACGYILYETSVALQVATVDADVVVSIMLFTSVMTLFFYILRLVMELSRE